MSCRFLIRVAASIAAVASITSGTVTVYAGGCGCEGPSQTVYHVHQRCGHHCHRCAPPVGMLVPAAPMMAAPMMAAPMMAAPVMAAPVMQAPMMMQAPVMQAPVMQAPVMTMSAPTIQLAPQTCAGSQNALQFSLLQGGTSASLTQDQLVRALAQAALENQAKSSPAALRGLNGSSLEERVKVLEERVDALKANTDELNASTLKIIEAVKTLQTKVNE